MSGCVSFREGANREKLTVKKLIDNEMFFFHRLCPLQTVKKRRKPWKNRHQTVKKSAPKIHHFFTVSFSPFTSSWNLSMWSVSPLGVCVYVYVCVCVYVRARVCACCARALCVCLFGSHSLSQGEKPPKIRKKSSQEQSSWELLDLLPVKRQRK